MTHAEIEEREVIEAYLQGRLSDDDRQTFEEHFFACEECFKELRTAGNFIAGVRQAAEAGLLPEVRRKDPALGRWWQPAFALGWAAAALLLIATVWLALFEVPQERRELAQQRAAVEAERGRSHDLETQLALEKQQAMLRLPATEGNIPLAMLEASRAGQANEVTMSPGASRLVLWIELDPGVRFATYSLQIRNDTNTTTEVIDGLTKNAQGALAASVSGTRLPAGTYTLLLRGIGAGQDTLVAEYRLVVHR